MATSQEPVAQLNALIEEVEQLITIAGTDSPERASSPASPASPASEESEENNPYVRGYNDALKDMPAAPETEGQDASVSGSTSSNHTAPAPVVGVSEESEENKSCVRGYNDALKDIPAEILPVEEKAVEPETSPTAEPEHDSRQAPSVEPEASASTATPRRTEIPAEMLAAWKDKKSSFQLGYINALKHFRNEPYEVFYTQDEEQSLSYQEGFEYGQTEYLLNAQAYYEASHGLPHTPPVYGHTPSQPRTDADECCHCDKDHVNCECTCVCESDSEHEVYFGCSVRPHEQQRATTSVDLDTTSKNATSMPGLDEEDEDELEEEAEDEDDDKEGSRKDGPVPDRPIPAAQALRALLQAVLLDKSQRRLDSLRRKQMARERKQAEERNQAALRELVQARLDAWYRDPHNAYHLRELEQEEERKQALEAATHERTAIEQVRRHLTLLQTYWGSPKPRGYALTQEEQAARFRNRLRNLAIRFELKAQQYDHTAALARDTAQRVQAASWIEHKRTRASILRQEALSAELLRVAAHARRLAVLDTQTLVTHYLDRPIAPILQARGLHVDGNGLVFNPRQPASESSTTGLQGRQTRTSGYRPSASWYGSEVPESLFSDGENQRSNAAYPHNAGPSSGGLRSGMSGQQAEQPETGCGDCACHEGLDEDLYHY